MKYQMHSFAISKSQQPTLLKLAVSASALVFIASLLTGCRVGPNFQKPVAWTAPTITGVTTTEHSSAKAAIQTVEEPMDPEFWHTFQDTTLDSLVRRAISANLDLKIAGTRLTQARAQARIVGADRLPHSEAAATYNRQGASGTGLLSLVGTAADQSAGTVAGGAASEGLVEDQTARLATPYNLWQYGFDASWEPDIWGRIKREAESASAGTQAIADEQRDVLTIVIADVARNYLELRSVQEIHRLTEEDAELARHSLQLVQSRQQAGVATKLDVADAQAYLHELESQLPPQEQQEESLIHLLSLLLAEPPSSLHEELSKPAPMPHLPAKLPTGVPSELAERRPDILAAEARLHAATANIGVAKGNFYPRIRISGSMGLQSLSASDLGSWASRQYAIGPTVSLPLFEGGRLRGELHLAEAQQQEAALAYQKSVLNAWYEIANALDGLSEQQRRRESLQAAVEQNHLAISVSKNRYQAGASNYLYVLTSQKALLQTQKNLVDSDLNISLSAIALYKALGGGWQTTYPKS